MSRSDRVHGQGMLEEHRSQRTPGQRVKSEREGCWVRVGGMGVLLERQEVLGTCGT